MDIINDVPNWIDLQLHNVIKMMIELQTLAEQLKYLVQMFYKIRTNRVEDVIIQDP